MDKKPNVWLLGAETAEKLFPLEPPLGSHVRVGGDYYHVIGVLEPLSQTTGAETGESATTTRAADHMFIPLETAKTRYGEVLMKRRSGRFESERVALHEVTVKVARREE